LTLEKLKHAEGEVLYVTHSAYLAQNARSLYYANGFEHAGQEAVFLSYREFTESIVYRLDAKPLGVISPAGFRVYVRPSRKLMGIRRSKEIRGVIAAGVNGILCRDDYRVLGVRQSIFAEEQRRQVVRPV